MAVARACVRERVGPSLRFQPFRVTVSEASTINAKRLGHGRPARTNAARRYGRRGWGPVGNGEGDDYFGIAHAERETQT